MAGPSDLYAAAQELLTHAAAAVALAPGGAISYQAICPGLPSFDCPEAIYVHAGGTSIGDTYPLQPPLQAMQRIVNTGEVNLVQMTVTVTRCVPVVGEQQTIKLPTPAEISAAAAIIYGDLWAVWNGLVTDHLNGTLFQRPSGRREFILDPANYVKTSGGVGGWEIPVRFELGGFRTS